MKYILLVIIVLLTTLQLHAAYMTNYTDTIGVDIDDVDFSPFSLSLNMKNVSVREFLPLPRATNTVAFVKSASFSLSVLRALFLLHMYVDEARVDGLYLRFIQKQDGTLALFSPGVDTNDIVHLFGSEEKKDAFEKDARKKASGTVTIPHIVFSDMQIVCSNPVEQTHVWSLDDAQFELHNFAVPMEKNKKTWQMRLQTLFNGNTQQNVSIDAAFRTLIDDPYMRLSITGTHVTAALFDAFHSEDNESHTVDEHISLEAENEKKTPGIIDMCFSNEWARLESAFEAQSYALRTHPGVSNFFSETAVSQITFDILTDVTITNKSFRPGVIATRFYTRDDLSPRLSIEFCISNTPQLLYGPYIDYFPLENHSGVEK
jgi:hypothetical protein